MFIFLTANTAFGQLLRLQTLVHHYLEHIERGNSTFIDFLSEHYAKEIGHPDNKRGDHQKLPFKAVGSQAVQLVTIVPPPIALISQIIHETVDIKKNIRKQEYYSNACLNSIWHPPRFS